MKKKSRVLPAACIVLLLMLAIGAAAGVFIYKNHKRMERVRFVKKLGNGLNIGNSLDVTGVLKYKEDPTLEYYETFWHNPRITRELFAAIRKKGFQSVRIPVTWEEHMDENGAIDNVWMDRVQEVVDMAYAEGLYIILDTHHETWLNLETEREDQIAKKLEKVWTQIAERFAAYDEHLLFEGLNEPRLRDTKYEWTAGTQELQEMVNRLNRVFVDSVRAVGGENESRYLLICPYAHQYDIRALEALDIPDGNIIVAVHAYIPYSFCSDSSGNTEFDESDAEDTQTIDELFAWLHKHYIKKGIPVMITEFGSKDKENGKERAKWLAYYLRKADGIPCFWWDEGSKRKLIDRESMEWTQEELVRLLLE